MPILPINEGDQVSSISLCFSLSFNELCYNIYAISTFRNQTLLRQIKIISEATSFILNENTSTNTQDYIYKNMLYAIVYDKCVEAIILQWILYWHSLSCEESWGNCCLIQEVPVLCTLMAKTGTNHLQTHTKALSTRSFCLKI